MAGPPLETAEQHAEPTFKSIVFMAVGLVLLTTGAFVADGVRRFTPTATRTPGIVTRLNAGGSHIQVTFETAAHDRVSFPQNGLIAGYAVGDRVVVLYRSSAPAATASIDAVGALWAGPIALFVLGGGLGLARWINRKGG